MSSLHTQFLPPNSCVCSRQPRLNTGAFFCRYRDRYGLVTLSCTDRPASTAICTWASRLKCSSFPRRRVDNRGCVNKDISLYPCMCGSAHTSCSRVNTLVLSWLQTHYPPPLSCGVCRQTKAPTSNLGAFFCPYRDQYGLVTLTCTDRPRSTAICTSASKLN
jgi:hypothetical protein